MPIHVASVPRHQPSCQPLSVLITLEGIGSRMSVASRPITSVAVLIVDGGSSSIPRSQDSICCPNNKNGSTGTSSTMHISGNVRNSSRMML